MRSSPASGPCRLRAWTGPCTVSSNIWSARISCSPQCSLSNRCRSGVTGCRAASSPAPIANRPPCCSRPLSSQAFSIAPTRARSVPPHPARGPGRGQPEAPNGTRAGRRRAAPAEGAPRSYLGRVAPLYLQRFRCVMGAVCRRCRQCGRACVWRASLNTLRCQRRSNRWLPGFARDLGSRWVRRPREDQ
jgi:hypothetical protein